MWYILKVRQWRCWSLEKALYGASLKIPLPGQKKLQKNPDIAKWFIAHRIFSRLSNLLKSCKWSFKTIQCPLNPFKNECPGSRSTTSVLKGRLRRALSSWEPRLPAGTRAGMSLHDKVQWETYQQVQNRTVRSHSSAGFISNHWLA